MDRAQIQNKFTLIITYDSTHVPASDKFALPLFSFILISMDLLVSIAVGHRKNIERDQDQRKLETLVVLEVLLCWEFMPLLDSICTAKSHLLNM